MQIKNSTRISGGHDMSCPYNGYHSDVLSAHERDNRDYWLEATHIGNVMGEQQVNPMR
jgi:hypothetical protein